MEDFLGTAIPFFFLNFTATFTVVGFIVAAIVVAVKRPGAHGVWSAFLNWFLLFGIGITYFYNGIMHTVFGDLSARLIGWENNGFQAEVGFASIGIALVALIAFPQRMPYSLKFAALVGPACFLWGAAGAHIADIINTGNMASHNAGTVLYTDILVPVIGFVLWGLSYATRDRRPAAEPTAVREAVAA